jgi:hypothetical protein
MATEFLNSIKRMSGKLNTEGLTLFPSLEKRGEGRFGLSSTRRNPPPSPFSKGGANAKAFLDAPIKSEHDRLKDVFEQN